MRKRIALLLVFAMLLSLCACNTNTTEPTKPSETKPSATTPNETKPGETNPAETKPGETDPVATNPGETNPSPTLAPDAPVTDVDTADKLIAALTGKGGNYRLTADISVEHNEANVLFDMRGDKESKNGNELITLDLNGKKLAITGTSTSHIFQMAGADLTIMDSSSTKTGTIVYTAGGKQGAHIFRVNSTETLTIHAGNFQYYKGEGSNASNNTIFSDGAVIIYGGVFECKANTNIYLRNNGTATIYGGTFNRIRDNWTVAAGYELADPDGDGWFTVQKSAAPQPTQPQQPTQPSTPGGSVTGSAINTLAELVTAMSGTGGTYYLNADISADHSAAALLFDMRGDNNSENGNELITLDLNGKKLAISGTSTSHIFQLAGADLTIKDSSSAKTGTIVYTAGGKQGAHMFRVNSTDTLTIYAANIQYYKGEGSNASNNTIFSDGAVIIYGGVFECKANTNIYLRNNGTATIYGGTFNRVRDNWTIAAGYEMVEKEDANGTKWYTVQKKAVEPKPTEPQPTAPPATEPPVTEPQPTDPGATAPAGYVTVANAEELRAALAAGQKAYLIADIFETNAADKQFVVNAVASVLDLNGHTITLTNVQTDVHFFNVLGNDGQFTIEDSSETKTGTIKTIVATDGVSSQVIRANSVNTLTINGGNFVYEFAEGITKTKENRRYFVQSNGTVIVNGGVFTNNVGGLSVNSYAGTLTVNGGKFNPAPTGVEVIYPDGYQMSAEPVDGYYQLVSSTPVDPTEPPATEPPATEPPATEPPATEPQPTEPEATNPVEGTPINTLSELVAAMSGVGGTYYLNADITADHSAAALLFDMRGDKNSENGNELIVLDLNGKTLSISGTSTSHIFQLAGADLTIKDSSVAQTGTILYTATGKQGAHMFRVNSTDTMTVYGGNILYHKGEGSNASNNTIFSDGAVIVYGGVFECLANTNIYLRNNGSATLYGGTFNRVRDNWTVADGYEMVEKEDTNGTKWYTVQEKSASTEPPATEPPATEPPATEPPATEPPATEPEATAPEGFTAVHNAKELQDVLLAGQYAWLANDISFNNSEITFLMKGTAEAPLTAMLDLNGKTITVTIDSTAHVFNLQAAELVIGDTSLEMTGTIKAIWNGKNAGVFRVNGDATLGILGGNYLYEAVEGADTSVSGNRYVVHSNGTTIIMAGTFKSTNGFNAVYGYGGALEIGGGLFYEIPKTLNIEMTIPEVCEWSAEPIDGWYQLIMKETPAPEGYTAINNAAELIAALHQNANGGKYYLAADIELPNTVDTDIIQIIQDTTLDLFGHILAIAVTDTNNVFSVQGTEDSSVDGATFVLEDSSVEGTGAIVAVIAAENAGGTLFRVNVMGSLPNYMEITGGIIGYSIAEGITTTKTPYLFNNSKGAIVTINGGFFLNEVGAAGKELYNTNNAAPIVYSGLFSMDPSTCLAPGFAAYPIEMEGMTWYIVAEATEPEATEPEATEPEATEPEATEPESTAPEGYVAVDTIEELKAALESGEKAYMTADIIADNANGMTFRIDHVVCTLDLNGYTLTLINVQTNIHFFQIFNESAVTIEDNSDAKTGTIKAVIATNGVSSQVFRVNSIDTLTVNGGTFIYEFAEGVTTADVRCNIVHANGFVVINDGTFINNVGGKTVNNYAGSQTFNGGRFNVAPTAADTEVIYPEGYFMSHAPIDGWYIPVKPQLGENETPEEEL